MFSLSSLFAVSSLFILAVFQIAVALPVVPLPFSRMAHDLEGRSLATDNYVRAAAATLPDGVITVRQDIPDSIATTDENGDIIPFASRGRR